MKRLLLVLLAAAVMLTPAVTRADTIVPGDSVYIKDAPGTNFGSGGAFILEKGAESFTTFCVEANEYLVSLPGWHVVGGVSKEAQAGGIGGGSPDPLDPATAYLYYQFRIGNPDFQDTWALQGAIWKIEGEYSNGLTGNALLYYNLALAAAAPGGSWGPTTGPVYIINLLKYNDRQELVNSQDVLMIPDGGMTLMLLGGALMGLGALRRKFRG